MTTYGYARVSTTEQVEGSSLASQERRVRAIAEFRGETMKTCFVDGGVSGSVPLFDRPSGKQLVDLLQPGDVVIASKLDRMFRNAQDALEWLDHFKKHDVSLILCDIGTDPVNQNGISKMFFTMLAAMAEFERDRIRERMDEGRKAKKAAGGWAGGRPPFGYKLVGAGKSSRCVPDPNYAAALASLRRCWSAGTSLRGAAQYVKSTHGIRMTHNQVGRVYEGFEDEHAVAEERPTAVTDREDVRDETSIS